jgi:hypothetical protein
MRGTGEDARELVGETERLPPRDPRFIASFFRLIVPPVGGVVASPHFPVRRCVTSLVSICRIDVQRRHLATVDSRLKCGRLLRVRVHEPHTRCDTHATSQLHVPLSDRHRVFIHIAPTV